MCGPARLHVRHVGSVAFRIQVLTPMNQRLADAVVVGCNCALCNLRVADVLSSALLAEANPAKTNHKRSLLDLR